MRNITSQPRRLPYRALALLLLLPLLLTGCLGVVVGATAGATAMNVMHDRRTLTVIRDDQEISYEISQKIYAPGSTTRQSDVSVATFNSVVLLVGQVSNAKERSDIDRIAQTTPKVKRIYNEITVSPNITMISRANDSWITTKVKTTMLAEEGLKASQIKVVTEDAVVYLMGQVTHKQAKLATDIARKVAGVQRVVRIFEYSKVSERK